MLKTPETFEYRIKVYADNNDQPIKYFLLHTRLDRADHLMMLVSDKMDVSIYDNQAEESKSYVFNMTREEHYVILENCEIFKQKADRPELQAFDAKSYVRPGLDEAHIEEIREVFDLIDEDGSGKIEPKELIDGM